MKNQNQPLVSIIMPVRNAGIFLVETIDSIKAQTYKNWELIVVDDYSTDGSYENLLRYEKGNKKIKVYRNTTKKGIGFSLNRALKYAKGDFIARQDADDISLPNRLEKQVKLLKDNKNIVACGGQAAIINAKGKTYAYKNFPTNPKTLYNMIMRVVPIQHPILLARAKVYKKYKYLENVKTAEDVDLLFYLLSRGDISNTKEIIYKYRKTNSSNEYKNVKQTFFITFATRFEALKKYNYIPTFKGLIESLIQLLVVSILPSVLVVKLFEIIRYEPPLWKKPVNYFQSISYEIRSLSLLAKAKSALTSI